MRVCTKSSNGGSRRRRHCPAPKPPRRSGRSWRQDKSLCAIWTVGKVSPKNLPISQLTSPHNRLVSLNWRSSDSFSTQLRDGTLRDVGRTVARTIDQFSSSQGRLSTDRGIQQLRGKTGGKHGIENNPIRCDGLYGFADLPLAAALARRRSNRLMIRGSAAETPELVTHFRACRIP
jgi:hypothetical protein